MRNRIPRFTPLLGWCCLLSGLCACQQKTIYRHYPFAKVHVVHQWPDSTVAPEGMRMLFYSWDPLPGIVTQNVHARSDSLRLIPGTYRVLGFSNDSEFLRVKNEREWAMAQVYIPSTTRVSNQLSSDQPVNKQHFYRYASNDLNVALTPNLLQIQAENLVYSYHMVGRVEGIREVTGCKAYLGGMIGARSLCNGEAAGEPGVQCFQFQLLSEGIDVLLPSLGPFESAAHPIVLEFLYPNGAVQRYRFELSLKWPPTETLRLPDIQLPTQTIGGGSSGGFQGHVDAWEWQYIPIRFEEKKKGQSIY